MAEAVIKARATLDGKQFEGTLARMKQGVASFGQGMMSKIGLGGGIVAAVGALAAFVGVQSNAAQALKRTADASGVSAGMLDELGDAAERTGASGEGFQSKIAKMVDSQESAVLGNKAMQESFARLGVSAEDLQNLSTDQLLSRIAQGAQNSATAFSDLNNIMGKGAAAEFGAALKDIADNGLPQVDYANRRVIEGFNLMGISIAKAKDSLMDMLKQGVVGGLSLIGLGPSMEKIDEAIRTSEEKRARDQKSRAQGLAREAAELKEKEFQKISEEEGRKASMIMAKRIEDIANITVKEPKSADSLASIGGIVGGQTNPLHNELQRQTEELKIISKSNLELQRLYAESNAKLDALDAG